MLQGNLSKVSELIEMLQEDGFSPNVATYIACFECVGRLHNDNTSRSKLKTWWALMTKQVWFLSNFYLIML